MSTIDNYITECIGAKHVCWFLTFIPSGTYERTIKISWKRLNYSDQYEAEKPEKEKIDRTRHDILCTPQQNRLHIKICEHSKFLTASSTQKKTTNEKNHVSRSKILINTIEHPMDLVRRHLYSLKKHNLLQWQNTDIDVLL